MLQGKKYIKFADENTVEVYSMGKIDLGISDGDPRLQTFKGKDGKLYLAGWPNLTLKDLRANNRESGRWNNTGRTPYTAIVNPHTNERMDEIKGRYAAGKLMEKVEAAKKKLNKQYGKSISRKKLKGWRKDEGKARAQLEKGDIAKAMSAAFKLRKKLAKQPEAARKIATGLIGDIEEAAGKRLDEYEALIGRGEKKTVARELGPLSRALKGTALEQRALDLLAKAKAE